MTTAARPVILASPHADGVRLDPQSYLGSMFQAYRDAVTSAGARFDGNIRANLIALDRLAIAKGSLAEAGFDLAIDPALAGAIEEVAGAAHAQAQAGQDRLAKVDARLAGDAKGRALWTYQRDGVRWLAPRRCSILADEMGLGKTIQVLQALPERAATLVVAPAAMIGVWVQETVSWRPDLRPVVIRGSRNFRWPMAGELIVMTYGTMPKLGAEMILPPTAVHLISDESHMLKGARPRGSKKGVQRVGAWYQLRDAVLANPAGVVWGMTGTPMLNNPSELWRVLQAHGGLGIEAFGTRARFNQLLGASRGRSGRGVTYGDISPEFALALQRVMLRRDRIAVLPDLPRKRRQVQQVEISDPDAIRACDALVAHLAIHGHTVDALADQSQLAKEVRTVIFTMLSKVRASLAAAKLPALLDVVEEYEAEELPVIVFSAHTAPLKAIAKRPGWALIDGDVDPDERVRLKDEFQAGRLRGLACSYAAAGIGLTLTAAHHVVCLDLPWTPALLQQAEDRVCRIGQEADSIHVRVLAADHDVDARVSELIVEKADLIERTVEAAAREQLGVDDVAAKRASGLMEIVTDTSALSADIAAERDRETARRAKVEQGRQERASGRFEVDPDLAHGTRRGPRDGVEIHAAGAMVQLANDDPDHAGTRNHVGFSAFDGEFGHSLAGQLVKFGTLSEKQWAAAVRMAKRYRRQVGDPA